MERPDWQIVSQDDMYKFYSNAGSTRTCIQLVVDRVVARANNTEASDPEITSDSSYTDFRNAGLDPAEASALLLTEQLANVIMSLPELHESDKEEYATAIHSIQYRLFSRPTYRKYLSTVNGKQNEQSL